MGWKDLIDNKLEKTFAQKSDNSEKVAGKRRDGVLKGIDAALAALKKNEAKGPRGWYKIANGVAALSLRTGTRVIKLDGMDTAFVPAERATDFYTAIRKEVEAKAFDPAIAAAWSGDAEAPVKKTRAKRGPMDPQKLAERNAKRAATLAAKKAG